MSSFAVSRSRVIDAPASALFPLVDDFRRWTAWSPWEDLDPTMTRDYSGASSGVGARYAWSGNRRAGRGTMEIVESIPHTHLQVRLAFSRPMKAVNPTTFTFDAAGTGTRVTWTMTGQNRGIGRLFALLVTMDKLVGKDFEKGLDRLALAVADSPTTDDAGAPAPGRTAREGAPPAPATSAPASGTPATSGDGARGPGHGDTVIGQVSDPDATDE